MTPIDPLPLFHSWPLFDASKRMDLRRLFGGDTDADALASAAAGPQADAPGERGIGIWGCDLSDNSLRWTQPVYDLFGLPMDEPLTRKLTLSCYVDRSRVAMEQLRAHAIRHRRGFTLDAMIRRPDGAMRWMRISALPVLQDGKVARLCGTKQDVTHVYDGPEWRAV